MAQRTIPAGLERRREDYTLITGHGHYVDDLRPPQGRPAALHMAVVRSPYAHAEIQDISLDAARAHPNRRRLESPDTRLRTVSIRSRTRSVSEAGGHAEDAGTDCAHAEDEQATEKLGHG